MVEKLAKLREPAVWIVLIVLWLRLLLALISVFTSFTISQGLVNASDTLLQPAGYLVLALLVASCALWRPTRTVRTLALLALITVAGSAVLGFFFGFGFLGNDYAKAYYIAAMVQAGIVGVIAWGLLTVYSGLPKPAPKQQAIAGGYGGYPPPGQPYGQPQQQPGQDWNQQAPYGQQSQPGYQPQPGQVPTWQPGQAAGQSWSTAGEAASGAAGSATGQQWGGPQGWGSAAGPQSSASAAEYTGPVPVPPAPPAWGQPAAPPAPSPQPWGRQPQSQPSAEQPAEPPSDRAGAHPLDDESAVQTRLVPPVRPSDSAPEGDTAEPSAGRDDQRRQGGDSPSWWDSTGR